MRLKKCPRAKDKSKYEVYHGVKPYLRRIRLLPIFAVLQVERDNVQSNPLMSNRKYGNEECSWDHRRMYLAALEL
jgi:hypothetical protein